MPTLNIKDPLVHDLATALAERRGISMTAAVRAALEEALEQDRQRRAGRLDRLEELSRRSGDKLRQLGIVPLTDDDLYDERGLPR